MPFFLYYIVSTGKEMKKTSRVSLDYASVTDRRSSELLFDGSSKSKDTLLTDSMGDSCSKDLSRNNFSELIHRKPTL